MSASLFKLMRQTLGLSAPGLGKLYGCSGRAIYQIEAGYDKLPSALLEFTKILISDQNALVENALAVVEENPETDLIVLVTYPAGAEAYCPHPHGVEFHKGCIAQIIRELDVDRVRLVDFQPEDFKEWLLGQKGAGDSNESRAAWAAHKAKEAN